MPGGDGTGPYGTGGWCTPLWRSGQIARPAGFGRGRGLGRGRGMGFGRGFYASDIAPMQTQPTKEQEIAYLEEESNFLAQQLESMKKRLDELRR